MERSYPISLLKADDTFSHGCDISSDIVALVPSLCTLWKPLGKFPVFWVGPRNDYLDEDLSSRRFWDGDILDMDRGVDIDYCFFHGELEGVEE
jgi:hypothetical protein